MQQKLTSGYHKASNIWCPRKIVIRWSYLQQEHSGVEIAVQDMNFSISKKDLQVNWKGSVISLLSIVMTNT